MDTRTPPASSRSDGPPRRPRPRHIWSFERLEDRTLLATGPVVATPAQLAAARPITGSASGLIAPGESDFFRLDASTDELLIAQAHAEGAQTRLSLLDAQGDLLTQSDGLSTADSDDLIAQHVGQGTYYLELTGTGGIGPFSMTTQEPASSVPGSTINLGNTSISQVVTGDFNGDGRADIAVGYETEDPTTGDVTGGGVSVLPGDGGGAFRSPVTYAAGESTSPPWRWATSPATAGSTSPQGMEHSTPRRVNTGGGVSVLLGDGDGGFTPSPTTYLAGDYGTSLVTGDFNGDGRTDLAAAYENFDPKTGTFTGGVSVLLGDGDGTFRGPVDYAVAGDVTSLAVGDFNGDGRADLAAGYQSYDPTTAFGGGGVGAAGRGRRDVPEPGQLPGRGQRRLRGGGRLQRRRPGRPRRRICESRPQ